MVTTNLQAKIGWSLKRHRRLAWFSLFATIIAICLVVCGRENLDSKPRSLHLPKPIAFSVSFQGYSNSLSGQRWAILVVTNRDFGNLYFSGTCLVEPLDHRLLHTDEDETRWQLPLFVAPRTSARIAVEIPPAFRTWRARCTMIRYTWRDYVHNALVGWRLDGLIPVRPTCEYGSLVTDWVSQ